MDFNTDDIPKGMSDTQHQMTSYLLGVQFLTFAIRYSCSYEVLTQMVSLNGLSEEQYNNVYYSFDWGYAVVLLPTAVIVNRCNPRLLLASALILSSIFHLFVPLVAKLGFVAVILCRIATGLCQGCILPSTFILMAQWIPRSNRAKLGGMIISANLLACTLIDMIFKITASLFYWDNLFYIYGGLGLFFGSVFYARSVNYSSDHVEETSDVYTNFQKLKIPWKGILTSLPVWAIIIAHCACTYGNLTYESIVPQYIFLKTHNITSNTTIPHAPVYPNFGTYLLMSSLNLFVYFAVELSTRQIITRKICNSIGTLVPAVMLVVLVLIKTSYNKLIGISLFGMLLRAFVYFGYFLNVLELSPNFVGVIVSIMEFFSTAVEVLLQPIILGTSARSYGINAFAYAICIGVAAYSLSNMIFLIFCSTEIQKWNGPINPVVSRPKRSPVAIDLKYDIWNDETLNLKELFSLYREVEYARQNLKKKLKHMLRRYLLAPCNDENYAIVI